MKENRDFGVRMVEQVEFNVESEPYKNFITSIDSPVTRCDYRYYLAYFMKFIKCTNYLDLIQEQPKQIESLIRDYIVYMRQDRKFSPATVSVRIAAISHFFDMNDVILNWKKIKKYKGKMRSVIEDRPYLREQIKKASITKRRKKKMIMKEHLFP